MSTEDKPDESFLGRWSRKKHESRAAPVTPMENPSTGAASSPETPETPRPSTTLPSSMQPALPPVESLTRESDFVPFMAQDVKAETRNAALKTLFTDPHFNRMDGLDVYIDDYTKSTPIPMEMLRTLQQARQLFAQEAAESTAAAATETAAAPVTAVAAPASKADANLAAAVPAPEPAPRPAGKDAS